MRRVEKVPTEWEERIVACTCDRCGGEITTLRYSGFQQNMQLSGINLPTPASFFDGERTTAPIRVDDYEVCRACYEEIYSFYKTPKKAVKVA